MNTTDRPIILLGDIHGRFDVILSKLNTGLLDDTILIQIGDFGLGFRPHFEKSELERIDKRLKEQNCELFVIRGNHDEPKWFTNPVINSEFNQKHKNITLLPDYYTKDINGVRFLFVGGAVSIDRYYRTLNESYWTGEVVQEPKFNISKHDILISHTVPHYLNAGTKSGGAYIESISNIDLTLKDDIKREGEIMDHVIKASEVREVYSGHYHNDEKKEIDGLKYRCINIDEFYELR